MQFLRSLLTTLLALGYTYNATIEQIYNSTEDIKMLFINSVNDFVLLVNNDTITASNNPYYVRAKNSITYYTNQNYKIGQHIAGELTPSTVTTTAPEYLAQPVLSDASWQILQAWAYSVNNGAVVFNLNGSGGLIHVSNLSVDEILTVMEVDVEKVKAQDGNSPYLLFKSYWEYLQSNPGFKTNNTFYIINEAGRNDGNGRNRTGFGFFYPAGSGTPGTVNLPFGNTGITVAVYNNDIIDGYFIGSSGNNYVTYGTNGEPITTQYMHIGYGIDESTGLKLLGQMPGVRPDFIQTAATITTTSKDNLNSTLMPGWLQNPVVNMSYAYADNVPANIKDITEGLNEAGTWDVITKGNNIDINGDITGEYTFTVPVDIQDVLIGVDSGSITTNAGLEKIGAVAVNTGNKTNIDGTLNYGQVMDDLVGNNSIPETPVTPTTQATQTGLFCMFNPTRQQVNALGSFLWSDITDLSTNIKKMLVDPMDVIIQLSLVPVKPSVGATENIKVAFIDSGVSAPKVTSQYVTKTLGSIYIEPQYKNFLDYNPYTEVHLYLPFVGMVQLDTDIVMGSTLSITYNIDLLTGGFSCNINVQNTEINTVMFTYGGTMSQQLPLTGSNYGQLYGNIASAIGGVAMAAIGAGGLIAGATAVGTSTISGVGEVLGSKVGVSHSGGVGGVTGFLSGFDAYAIIKRPVPYISGGYNKVMGKPSSIIRKLDGLLGYTVAENAILNIPNATAEEIVQIRELLSSGIYITK